MSVGYAVDPLSAWFLVVLAVLAAPVAVYSVGYLAHAIPPGRTAFVGVAWNVLLMSVETVFAADGVLGFLVAWELMTLATAALVATDHESRPSRRSAYLYLAMSHLGTGCLVAAFFLLASGSGSLVFPGSARGRHSGLGPWRDVLFVLFFVGFGVKAGVVPLHVWLPEAHPAAPSNVSAPDVGVPHQRRASTASSASGAAGSGVPTRLGHGRPAARRRVSAVLGVLYALSENDLKRLLAYSTIENGGISAAGLWGRDDRPRGGAARARARSALRPASTTCSTTQSSKACSFSARAASSPPPERGRSRSWAASRCACRGPRRFFLSGSVAMSGLPPPQRLRERVARLPGLPARLLRPTRLTAASVPARRGTARPDERAGRSLFREGLRDHVPRPAPQPRCGRGARVDGAHARPPGVSRRGVCRAGSVPGRRACASSAACRFAPGVRAAGRLHGAARRPDHRRLAGFDHLSPPLIVPARPSRLGLAAALGPRPARPRRGGRRPGAAAES